MTRRRMLAVGGGWLASVTGLHSWLNVNWSEVVNEYKPKEKRKLNVAYIPVP